MTSSRRPSLTFGTHSMSGIGLLYHRSSCRIIASRMFGGRLLSLICPIRSARTINDHKAPSIDGDAERDAKIESLLLSGLDHYFAADYAQAIDVWTRALFLDRQHARARAYIERARSALAEQQRESDELLHNGVAAFERGEIEAARQLLNAAVQRGGAHEVALAFLTRIDRHQRRGAGVRRRAAPSRLADARPHRPRALRRDRRGWHGPIVLVALCGDRRCLRRVVGSASERWIPVLSTGRPKPAWRRCRPPRIRSIVPQKRRDGARSCARAVCVGTPVRRATRRRSRAADRSAARRRRQAEGRHSARACSPDIAAIAELASR